MKHTGLQVYQPCRFALLNKFLISRFHSAHLLLLGFCSLANGTYFWRLESKDNRKGGGEKKKDEKKEGKTRKRRGKKKVRQKVQDIYKPMNSIAGNMAINLIFKAIYLFNFIDRKAIYLLLNNLQLKPISPLQTKYDSLVLTAYLNTNQRTCPNFIWKSSNRSLHVIPAPVYQK